MNYRQTAVLETLNNKLSSRAHESTTPSSRCLQSIVRCNQSLLHWQHEVNCAFGAHVCWHVALWGPTCSFSCLSQKGQTWSLQPNGSALFYSPVHWINLQSKGFPPYEILWAQIHLWAYNWTELKHFCTPLKSSKWLFLQFNLPPVDTAWTEKCTLNSCSFREFAKGCPAIPCNPQWTFSVFAKWIILQSSGSRHCRQAELDLNCLSQLMLAYSDCFNFESSASLIKPWVLCSKLSPCKLVDRMKKRSWLGLTLPSYGGTLPSATSLAGLNTATKNTSPNLPEACCMSGQRQHYLHLHVPDYQARANLPSLSSLASLYLVQANRRVVSFLEPLERCLCPKLHKDLDTNAAQWPSPALKCLNTSSRPNRVKVLL